MRSKECLDNSIKREPKKMISTGTQLIVAWTAYFFVVSSTEASYPSILSSKEQLNEESEASIRQCFSPAQT